jgi:hypothetical protein
MSKPLSEQFEALPIEIQSRMFGVLDLIIGMSKDEKREAFDNLGALGSAEITLADSEKHLFRAVQALVHWSHITAGGDSSDFYIEQTDD